MRDIWFEIRGYVAAAIALVACPCHLVVTLPLLLGLTAGTVLGAFLRQNTWLVFGVSIGLFVIGLYLALRWMGQPTTVTASPPRQPRPRRRRTNITIIDGNKILLGIGALIVLIGVGAFAFWFAGQNSEPAVARQPVAQAQPQVQQVQPRVQQVQPAAPQLQPQTSSQAQPARQSQPETSSQSRSGGGSGGVSVGLAGDPSKGEVAPDFGVPTLDGGTFTLSEQRGKPAVIFIMAYWCPTCIPEARALKQLHEEYGDKVSILALDVDPSSSPEQLRGFVEWAGNPTYTFGFDKDNTVVQKYKVRSLDTTIIVDGEGNIVYRDAYPTSYDTLKAQLEKLVS